MTAPLQDADVRRRASRSTDNVAVTAGAGTGKTTLLIDTVLAKLLVSGRDIRRMLLLTFTEKAANEMRVRLGERLLALSHPQTAEDRAKRKAWEDESSDFDARLKAAIEGIDRAEIGTIHSFCAHVLREHPIEAGLDPAFTVDEGPAFDTMFEQDWSRWLERELGADAPRKVAWLRIFAKEVTLAHLEAAARELASFRVPLEALDPGIARRRGEKALEALLESKAKAIDAVIAKCGETNRLRDQLALLAAHLRDPKKTDAGFLEKDPSEAKKGWGLHFEEASRTAAEGWKLAKAAGRVDGDLLAEVLALLGDFARSFRHDYTTEGFVAFDGLLSHVRELLLSRDFPGIRERLKAKYDFILVDEFQDTDPAQCEILLLLAEEGRARSAADVTLRRGKLFIVGDPKQSIYSFRGADIVAYEEVKNRIVAASGREEVLRTNFRSHAGIIRTVNAVFGQLIKPAKGLQPDYEEILPRDPAIPAKGLELTLFGSDRKLDSDEFRRAEASWIAKRIRADVGRVELPIDGGLKPLEYRHVAILFKALPDVHLYLDALRAEGVPYVVEGEKFFYGTSEVIDFVNLLRAAADPHDRIAIAGLLRSPIGGVDDVALVALKGRLDYRVERKGEPGIFATLRDLHAAVGTRIVPAFIDLVFSRTFVLETAAASYHGEQAVANLLKIRRTAEQLDAHGGLTLRQFLAKARENIREMAEEGESPLADETLDAVRIMSIHKAKGLEFPVVVLPDLHRQRSGGDDHAPVRFDWPTYTLGLSLGDVPDAGGAALAHQELLRRREETRRVLYVAMTRARERILMTGRADFKSDSYLGLLSDAVPGLGDAAGPVDVGGATLEVAREMWQGERGGRKAEGARKALKADWKKIAAAWKRREAECGEILATPRFTSPSRLQEKRQVIATRDELEKMERGAAIGTLCHRVLESLDFAQPQVGPLVDRHSDDPAVAAEAKEILAKFLKTPAFKAVASSTVLARELPFLLKKGDSILQGAIDLVVQEGKRVVVVDWKSDRGGAKAEKKEKYAEQRKWYLEAVQRVLGVKKAAFRLVFLRTGEVLEW